MLVKVAMFVGSFSLRLSHEAGSSLATLSLLNLQTGMNGDMWASLLSPKPSSTRLRCGHTNSYAQWMEACDAVDKEDNYSHGFLFCSVSERKKQGLGITFLGTGSLDIETSNME